MSAVPPFRHSNTGLPCFLGPFARASLQLMQRLGISLRHNPRRLSILPALRTMPIRIIRTRLARRRIATVIPIHILPPMSIIAIRLPTDNRAADTPARRVGRHAVVREDGAIMTCAFFMQFRTSGLVLPSACEEEECEDRC